MRGAGPLPRPREGERCPEKCPVDISQRERAGRPPLVPPQGAGEVLVVLRMGGRGARTFRR